MPAANIEVCRTLIGTVRTLRSLSFIDERKQKGQALFSPDRDRQQLAELAGGGQDIIFYAKLGEELAPGCLRFQKFLLPQVSQDIVEHDESATNLARALCSAIGRILLSDDPVDLLGTELIEQAGWRALDFSNVPSTFRRGKKVRRDPATSPLDREVELTTEEIT